MVPEPTSTKVEDSTREMDRLHQLLVEEASGKKEPKEVFQETADPTSKEME
jgi:hypothetical protein